MAFSNALLGIVHSMAHKTGAAFSTGHITHGLANAMYLPYVIKYNAKDPVAAKRYAEIDVYKRQLLKKLEFQWQVQRLQ